MDVRGGGEFFFEIPCPEIRFNKTLICIDLSIYVNVILKVKFYKIQEKFDIRKTVKILIVVFI